MNKRTPPIGHLTCPTNQIKPGADSRYDIYSSGDEQVPLMEEQHLVRSIPPLLVAPISSPSHRQLPESPLQMPRKATCIYVFFM